MLVCPLCCFIIFLYCKRFQISVIFYLTEVANILVNHVELIMALVGTFMWFLRKYLLLLEAFKHPNMKKY